MLVYKNKSEPRKSNFFHGFDEFVYYKYKEIFSYYNKNLLNINKFLL